MQDKPFPPPHRPAAEVNRRRVLRACAGAAVAGLAAPRVAFAAPPQIGFGDLYSSYGALGLTFSDKIRELTGAKVAMDGFMAPPLKAEARFFVLTEIPMALCPFCSSDADWPDNIMVVYLSRKQTFTPPNQTIRATGLLDRGSWTDPDTGFVSQLRLREARFDAV